MNDINSMAYWKKIDDLKVKMDKDPQLMQQCKDNPAAFIKEHGIDAEIRINEKGDKKLLSEYLAANKIDFSKDVTLVGKRPGDNLAAFIFVNVAANANAAANANIIANANVVINTNAFGKPIYPESLTKVESNVVVQGDTVKSSADVKSNTQAGGIGVSSVSTAKSQVTSNVKTHADIMSDARVRTSVSGQGSKPTVSGTEVATVSIDSIVEANAKTSAIVLTSSSVNSDGVVSVVADAAVKGDGIVVRPRPDLRIRTAVRGADIKPIETFEPVQPIRPGRPARPIATIKNEDAKNHLIGEYDVSYDIPDDVYEIFKRELDNQNLSKERQQAVIKRAVTNPDRVLDAKVFKREDGTEKELKPAEFKREVRLGDKAVTERLSKEMAEMIEAKKYSLDETVEYQYKDKRFRMHITISGKHVTINNVEVTDNE